MAENCEWIAASVCAPQRPSRMRISSRDYASLRTSPFSDRSGRGHGSRPAPTSRHRMLRRRCKTRSRSSCRVGNRCANAACLDVRSICPGARGDADAYGLHNAWQLLSMRLPVDCESSLGRVRCFDGHTAATFCVRPAGVRAFSAC